MADLLAPSNSATEELSKEDIIAELGKEDEVVDDKKDDKKKEDTKEDDKEEDKESKKDEIQLVDNEEGEEEPEVIAPPRKKEILKKYPDIFKDFPHLEKAYYRDQQFTELLPTIDDAKEVIEKAGLLDNFEAKLMEGSTVEVLKAVKETNQESFNKMVDNYLPALQKVDNDAYYHVIGNVIKNTIISMAREAKNSQDEGLQAAALAIQKFVFGTTEFVPPGNLSKGDADKGETDKLKSDREAFTKERFEFAQGDLDTKIHNVLKSTVDAHIDPKESMTEYVKRNAVREAVELVDSTIEQDVEFRKTLDNLWKTAFEKNFDATSLARIKSAYLSKARTILPQIISKTRNEALRGLGKRTQSDDDNKKDKRGPITPGRPSTSSSGKTIKEAKDIPRGMKTLDFLNMD